MNETLNRKTYIIIKYIWIVLFYHSFSMVNVSLNQVRFFICIRGKYNYYLKLYTALYKRSFAWIYNLFWRNFRINEVIKLYKLFWISFLFFLSSKLRMMIPFMELNDDFFQWTQWWFFSTMVLFYKFGILINKFIKHQQCIRITDSVEFPMKRLSFWKHDPSSHDPAAS